ncbi:hypothetical protein K461DRAFT_4498 [Myriangium duriaei CBS 260.36]|uniref:Uncharacterized protein n=1 Tax=Myriangium duriaei CBS 260.36 TaxID=1168546 RepID=A0A9P4JBX1_9PEZI|nr:hypothetical protein K461DRAFT_4498 [Myriangium duriaei CBS 260.36]
MFYIQTSTPTGQVYTLSAFVPVLSYLEIMYSRLPHHHHDQKRQLRDSDPSCSDLPLTRQQKLRRHQRQQQL